jgi:hypothetical protein
VRVSQSPQELIEAYTAQADLCRQEAAGTILPHQVERLRQAEESWLALAEAQRNIQIARARRLGRGAADVGAG